MPKLKKVKKLKKIKKQILNKAQFADYCGVRPSSISLAIRDGRVVENDERQVDTTHPVNLRYKKMCRSGLRKQGDKPSAEKDVLGNMGRDEIENFTTKKTHEQYRDIKYKAATRELDYFLRLGSLMDVETVRHSFTPFVEALYNNLIYIPDKIDDPAIAARVKDLIRVAIKKAKEESDKILPPKSRRYVTLEDED